MQTIAQSYHGLSLLVGLNWDRVLMTAIIFGSLYAGSYVALM